MRRARWSLAAAVLLASCTPSPGPIEQAIGAVTEARTSAFGEAADQPVEPWIDLFTEDATIVMARGEANADSDYPMSRLQYGGLFRMEQCRSAYFGPQFEVRSSRMVGDDVELTIEPYQRGEVVVNRLRMRKLDGKWRVVQSRHWRERWSGMHGEKFLYDDAHWARVDGGIDAYLEEGDPVAAMYSAQEHRAYGRFDTLAVHAPEVRSDFDRRYLGETLVLGGKVLEGVRLLEDDPDMSEAEVRRHLIDWCVEARAESERLDD